MTVKRENRWTPRPETRAPHPDRGPSPGRALGLRRAPSVKHSGRSREAPPAAMLPEPLAYLRTVSFRAEVMLRSRYLT